MSVPVSIFILCYNESALLPHTIKHYRERLPNSKITIYDNESTDGSVNIAKSLGCNVVSWSSGNINNVLKKQYISNNCWKEVTEGWVITTDMDEWLCITEDDLNHEYTFGTTILKTCGINIIGKSNSADLSDLDLHAITDGVHYPAETKNVCFLRNKIDEMNYGVGCHCCKPTGESVINSKKTFIIKHMDWLGLPFITRKYKQRYERSSEMRKLHGYSTHYTDNEEEIHNRYNNFNENIENMYKILADVTREPHFNPNDIYMFYDILNISNHYFEYGSGGSTIQAAKQENIKTIHSVESDPEWYKNVCNAIETKKPITLMYRHLNAAPNMWGYPGEGCLIEHAKEYSRSILSLSKTESTRLDMILIDGRFRVACCLHCFEMISDDCLIVFDDFLNRPYYNDVLEFYDIVRKTEDNVMVVLKKKKGIDGPSQDLLNKYDLIPQ
jgi:glycosyltransferase involved in cell wall biosynthesis